MPRSAPERFQARNRTNALCSPMPGVFSDDPAGTTERRSSAFPGVRPVRAQPPTTYQRFAPKIIRPQPTRMPRKAQSRRRCVDWNASRKRRTRKTGDRRRRFNARRMIESTRVDRTRGKNPAASSPGASRNAGGPGLRTRIAGTGRPPEGGAPLFRMGNCESVASGGRRGGTAGAGMGTAAGTGGRSSRRGRSSGGRSVTPELWTAARATEATTAGGDPARAASSTPRKRPSAEISRGDGAPGSGSAGADGASLPGPGESGNPSAADGMMSDVFSTGPLGSRSRYSMTAAPTWRRSPLLRIVSFRIRRPATNVPLDEFRSLRTAVPLANERSAWLLETDSWSTRTVAERLRPSVTSPSESSISRPSTTRM